MNEQELISIVKELQEEIIIMKQQLKAQQNKINEFMKKIYDEVKQKPKDYEHNKSLDRLCSWCNRYADIVIPNKIKLCNTCFEESMKK